MKKIAILKKIVKDYDYEGSYTILEKITDFCEVDDDTYAMLYKAQYKYNFIILEQPINIEEFILKTVEDYKMYVKRMEDENKKLKEKHENKRLKSKIKREEKEKEKRKALLEQLKKEFEE